MLDYFRKDIGVDLGTANTLLYAKGKGIVLSEPSLAAFNNKTGQILAIGHDAKKMVGRTPSHISVVRPLIGGVISDFETTEEVLRHFLNKIGLSRLFHYLRVVVGVPSNITEVERKSVEDAVISAGANKAYLIEESIASALGARLPIWESTANMIVDIGGGTTEIAVISTGGTVTTKSLKVAGDKLTEDIIRFIREEFKLAIGEPTAEELKIQVGQAVPNDERLEAAVRGRDMATGLPREIILKSSHVRAAIYKSLKIIVEAVRETIELTPPELVGDILRHGIYLSGGTSLLKGIDQLIEREIAVKVAIVDDPLTAVARGAGIAAENIEKYLHIFATASKPTEINI